MKRFLLVIMLMFIILSVSGCTSGSYTFFHSIEITEKDSWYIKYQKFNGHKQREITLDGEGEHTFTVDIVTDSGVLDLKISSKDGSVIYTGKELPSSSFEVKANKNGRYIIRFDGHNHNGSFKVEWK